MKNTLALCTFAAVAFALAFAAAPAPALAADSAAAAPVGIAPPVDPCAPLLLFEAGPSPAFTPAATAETWKLLAPPEAAPLAIRKTCKCSCGFPCTTSADCGGAACTPGITCCAMPPRNDDFAPAAPEKLDPAATATVG